MWRRKMPRTDEKRWKCLNVTVQRRQAVGCRWMTQEISNKRKSRNEMQERLKNGKVYFTEWFGAEH